MQRFSKYIPFIASSVLLVALVVFYYPYCQYYIDPDATAYLTISQRYADGDFFNAINGYWSPWSCWFTALFIKAGTSAIAGAITANAIAAVLLLWVTQSFFLKYSINIFSQWLMCIALTVFLSYAVYWQNFDDLWECFFLLYALRIIVSHQFRHRLLYWVGAGVLGALAYFAKAYAFPFFIFSSIAVTFYITRAWRSANRVAWLKVAAVMIVVMIACSSPWLYALYHKYGMWTTGTAGSLNMSWYLVGHPYWKDGIEYLLPPPYANSVSYWEDPWLVNGATPKFWSSADLFIRQLQKLVQNSFKFTISSLQIGVSFLLVWVYIVWLFLFRKTRRQKYKVYYPIIIPFLLFPLPFFLINFEARYIWYTLPLSMVLGVAIIKRNRLFNKRWAMVLFAISYIVWPLYGMLGMWNVGKQEYRLAQKLKQENIRGTYASNVIFGNPDAVAMQRVAYFTGNAYYIMHKASATFQELLPELRKHNVKYYYYYPQYNPDWKMVDEEGKPFIQLKSIAGNRVLLYKLQTLQTNEEFLNEILSINKNGTPDTAYGRDTIVPTLVIEAPLPTKNSDCDFCFKNIREGYGSQIRKIINDDNCAEEIIVAIESDTLKYNWDGRIANMRLILQKDVHKVYMPWSDSSLPMKKRIALFNRYWSETKPYYDIKNISKPYYDKQHDYAIIYRASSVSNRAGGLYVYKQRDRKWVYIGYITIWIS